MSDQTPAIGNTIRLDFDLIDIASEQDAAKAVDMILSARDRVERLDRAAAERAAESKRLIEEAQRRVAMTEALCMPGLESWAKANPPKRGKTIHLSTGSVFARQVGGGPVVVDDDAALAWAEQHLPAAVKVEKSVLRTPLKDYIKATGVVVPGVTVEPVRDKFDVK